MGWVEATLALAYASLAWELCIWRVPSVASTWQLVVEEGRGDTALAAARRLSPVAKLLRFGLPAAGTVIVYAVPLLAVFWPAVLLPLLPVDGLDALPWQVIGVAAVLGGRILTLAAVVRLRAHVDRAEIQTRGAYAWSRNPALLGLWSFLAGAMLLQPAWLLWLGGVAHGIAMHRRVLLEESHLALVGGDAYRAYCARVPRYVGLPGSGGTRDISVPR